MIILVQDIQIYCRCISKTIPPYREHNFGLRKSQCHKNASNSFKRKIYVLVNIKKNVSRSQQNVFPSSLFSYFLSLSLLTFTCYSILNIFLPCSQAHTDPIYIPINKVSIETYFRYFLFNELNALY